MAEARSVRGFPPFCDHLAEQSQFTQLRVVTIFSNQEFRYLELRGSQLIASKIHLRWKPWLSHKLKS